MPTLPAVPELQFLRLDEGRLIVRCDCAEQLKAAGLTTFLDWFHLDGGQVVRKVKQRWTTRLDSGAVAGLPTLYLKRHNSLPPVEYLRAALRLNWPVHGARPEWEAILAFRQAGIPTLTPVAFGESCGSSFLVTEALEGFVSLRDVLQDQPCESVWVDEVAALARRMHAAGLAHQDFYLDHLLVPEQRVTIPTDVRVIDLGRVRRVDRLGRWTLKDLAQLNYSARRLPLKVRQQFLERYLGRSPAWADALWLSVLMIKSWWIARHSRRRAL